MELHLLLGNDPQTWASLLALALTYVAHSVVWAAAVALLVRSKSLSPATTHACWMAALFGPLFSAGLATAASFALPGPLLEGSTVITASLGASVAAGAASATAAPSAVDVVVAYLPTARMLALLGLSGMGVGLLRFGSSSYLLLRSLRGRAEVCDRRVLRRFARLRARMGLGAVRLTASDTLLSPAVIGAREVCVPRRLFADLDDAEMDAVLAHELAHVERRDGLWFPLVAAVQSALWLQPLNHLVSSYVRHSAELACDDRAVELTGSPLGLARALVHVAERASQARRAMFVPMMVRYPSALLPRVRRLAKRGTSLQPQVRARRWRTRLELFVVGAGLVMLSVRVRGASAESPDAGRWPSLLGAAILPSTPPDVAAQNAQLAALATREQALLVELATVEARSGSRAAGTPDHVRALELSQELRHVRGTQAWLEERFVAQWAALDARSPAPR